VGSLRAGGRAEEPLLRNARPVSFLSFLSFLSFWAVGPLNARPVSFLSFLSFLSFWPGDEALRLLRDAVTGEVGDNQHTEVDDNITDPRETGTSKDYTLDRPAREAPELGRPSRNLLGAGWGRAGGDRERSQSIEGAHKDSQL